MCVSVELFTDILYCTALHIPHYNIKLLFNERLSEKQIFTVAKFIETLRRMFVIDKMLFNGVDEGIHWTIFTSCIAS